MVAEKRTVVRTDNNAQSFSFKKAEHLCSKKRIETLFSEGDAFIVYPLRVVYKLNDYNGVVPVSVLCSVSKKRFKRAVDRNRVKRLMRECYRLNKSILCPFLDQKSYSLDIAFICLDKELPDYCSLEQSMKKILIKLTERLL